MKSQKIIGIISIVLVCAVLGFVIYTHFKNKKACTCEDNTPTPTPATQARESVEIPLEEISGMEDFNDEL